MALKHRPVFVHKGDKLCTMFNFIQFVFYSHTFIFMLNSNKVWEKRLISGLSQAGTAWLRKSSRYDSRNFWAGLGGPSTSSRLR